MSEKWIQGAINPAHKGALREKLHVKEGHDIPKKKLEAASKKPGVLGHQARLAETLSKLRSK